VSDAQTTVLYALSTLAQTCAALAAFVGAIGLYHLQVLREQHQEVERDLRGVAAHPAVLGPEVAARLPFDEIFENVLQASTGTGGINRLARDTLVRWQADRPLLQRSQRALVVFEAWNLLVIGVALVGFNYVPALASSPTMFWAIWAAAVGTVVVTGYCMFAWTGR
jgi:hypothetical protein